MRILQLLLLLGVLSGVVFGLPESRYARVRELGGRKYKDDYKVFIDDSAMEVSEPKDDRPLFSWDVAQSSVETYGPTPIEAVLKGLNQNNKMLEKPSRNRKKGRGHKNRNRNDSTISRGKARNKPLTFPHEALELNVTSLTKNRNSSLLSNKNKPKNKNRKNKPSVKKPKQQWNRAGKKNKQERKLRRSRKKNSQNINSNDLPGAFERYKPNNKQFLLSVSGGNSKHIMKTDDDIVDQTYDSLPDFLAAQREDVITNDTKKTKIKDPKEIILPEPNKSNPVSPLLPDNLIAKVHNITNDKEIKSSSELLENTTAAKVETESATVRYEFDHATEKYNNVVGNKNMSNPKITDSTSLLGKNYNMFDAIGGDISCLLGTFLPAPSSSHAAIRYVRSQSSAAINLVAEYECELLYHLENEKAYQLVCSERKWIGIVPTCVPDVAIQNQTTCHEGKGNCDHICEIVENKTSCACYKGFQLENGTCKDINECENENGGCEKKCQNSPGSYYCSCPQGLRLADDRKTCVDINECLLRNGHGPCQDVCLNKYGDYECSCKGISGTRLGADNHTCQDIDECAEGTAGCSHTCLNTFGSAFCLCPQGFMLGDDWKTCQDIDECTLDDLKPEQCEFGCVNTIGSYRCLGPQNDRMISPNPKILIKCSVGYKLDSDGNCVDVDECDEKTSGCEQGCLNTKGSFQCYCGLGYKLAVDNTSCEESKETVCPPLENPYHGYWECARHLIKTKKSKFPWMKRTRVVNHAGAICQLKCPPGFILEGEFHKICGLDSKWKGPEDGLCVRKIDYMFNAILKI